MKFLVLGIGSPQKDLIDALTGLHTVYACSNSMTGPARSKVEHFELIDITSKDDVYDYVLKNNIDVIYSVGSDVAMPTVTYVSEKLGLPTFVNYETAQVCNSKNMFREKLKDTYGSVGYSLIASEQYDVNLRYPIIVKPVDSQGQRGVRKVMVPEDLQSAYKEAVLHSRSGCVIAEEYVEGKEISVNAYIQDGELKVFLPSDRISWPDSGGGFIHKHVLPCALNELQGQNIRRLVESVCHVLNIMNGPVYFQIKLDGDDAKLIEVTPRLDGCHMWKLIKYATGIDLLEMTISGLLGTSSHSSASVCEGKWVLEFFCSPPATKFDSSLCRIEDNAVYHEFYYSDGDEVRRMNGSKEKCGYQIYKVLS